MTIPPTGLRDVNCWSCFARSSGVMTQMFDPVRKATDTLNKRQNTIQWKMTSITPTINQKLETVMVEE